MHNKRNPNPKQRRSRHTHTQNTHSYTHSSTITGEHTFTHSTHTRVLKVTLIKGTHHRYTKSTALLLEILALVQHGKSVFDQALWHVFPSSKHRVYMTNMPLVVAYSCNGTVLYVTVNTGVFKHEP